MRNAVLIIKTLVFSLFFILFSSTPAHSAEKEKNVLIIASYSRNNIWSQQVISQTKESLQRNLRHDISLNYTYIYLNSKEIASPARRSLILQKQLENINDSIDLIIATGYEAVSAIIDVDTDLLFNTPIIFASFGERNVILNSNKEMYGVISSIDIDDNYYVAKAMFPEAKKLYIINDHTLTGNFMSKKAKEQLASFQNEIEIIYDISADTEEHLYEKIKQFEKNSIVFLLTWQRDNQGCSADASITYPNIVKFSKAPVFSISNHFIEQGLIGGYVLTPEAFAADLGQMGAEILESGTYPYTTISFCKSTPVFNKRAIQFHHGNLSAIPLNSTVINSFWGFVKEHALIITFIFIGIILLISIIFSVYYRISYKKIKKLSFDSEEFLIAKNRKDLLTWQYNYEDNLLYFGEEANNIGIKPHDVDTVEKLLSCIHPEDLPHIKSVYQDMKNHLLTEISVSYRADFRKDSHFEWWECRGNIIKGKDKFLSYGILYNINQLMETEEKLKEALVDAQNSDKLKSAFVANMSHEIRTPLNSILGFSQLLSETDDLAERKEFSEIIQKNGEALLTLVNEILDLSKIEAGNIEYHHEVEDFSSFFDFLSKSFSLLVTNPDVLFVSINPYKKCVLSIDKYRVKELYDNFISNAIKYTKKGSITMGYEYEDNGLKMYVSDTGIGIPSKKKEMVFQRFEKLDSQIKGTGLGLTICKEIVQRVDGVIDVDSEEGKGSTFWAWIPRKCEELVPKE